MNCAKCGEPAECRTAKVYYARVISEKSTTQSSFRTTQTTTTTTYSTPRDETVPICLNCIIKKKRRNLLLTPLYTLLLVGIIGQISPDSAIFSYILLAFWAAVIVIVFIILIRGKYKTQISDGQVYDMASTQLKKQLKKSNKKSNYMFWKTYPSHLKNIKY